MEGITGAIRDKMKAEVELRRYAETTKKEYLRRAQNFVVHYRRPPTELGQAEIHKFLLRLVEESKVAAAPHLLTLRQSTCSTTRRSAGHTWSQAFPAGNGPRRCPTF
jgi:hypothetical protein